jgi:uncharacterized membrane-anchored protein YhcB (DUF1043 family)
VNVKDVFYICVIITLGITAGVLLTTDHKRADTRQSELQQQLDGVSRELDNAKRYTAELIAFNSASINGMAELKSSYNDIVRDAEKISNPLERLGITLAAISTLAGEYENILRQYGRAITTGE